MRNVLKKDWTQLADEIILGSIGGFLGGIGGLLFPIYSVSLNYRSGGFIALIIGMVVGAILGVYIVRIGYAKSSFFHPSYAFMYSLLKHGWIRLAAEIVLGALGSFVIGIAGFIGGMTYGGNYYFEFAGQYGYEAGGIVGTIIGLIMGSILTTYFIRRIAYPNGSISLLRPMYGGLAGGFFVLGYLYLNHTFALRAWGNGFYIIHLFLLPLAGAILCSEIGWKDKKNR